MLKGHLMTAAVAKETVLMLPRVPSEFTLNPVWVLDNHSRGLLMTYNLDTLPGLTTAHLEFVRQL